MRKNSVVNNGVSMGQLLEFEVVFPDEMPRQPEEYLAGGDRDFILNIAAAFLGFKSQNSKFNKTFT